MDYSITNENGNIRLNMKRQLLLAALMLVALGSNAQTEKGRLTIQPRVGMTVANFTGGGSGLSGGRFGIVGAGYGGLTGKFGFTGGVDLEYGLSDLWSVSVGMGYIQLGARDDCNTAMEGSLTDGQQNYQIIMTGKNNMKYSLDYLTVPATIALYPYRGLSLRTGLQLGFCLIAHVEGSCYMETMPIVPGHSKQSFPSWQTPTHIERAIDGDIEHNVRKLDLGIPVGLAYEYENFVLDARYVFGLLNLSKNEYDGHMRNSAFSLTLGYKFVIK